DLFSNIRRSLAADFGVIALVLLLSTAPGHAQTPGVGQRQKLLALQQQNAFQQQQMVVQNAVQATAILVQRVNRQNDVPPHISDFQQQQVDLRIAIQQTRALLHSSQRQNSALSRTALGQINALQAVLHGSLGL